MSETKQRYNNKSVYQTLSKKILISTIDYLRYKVENEKLTVAEMQSLVRFFCEGLNLEGTADDFAEFLDSFTHELRHLADDIATFLGINLRGEEVAYLTGDTTRDLAEVVCRLGCPDCG